MRKPTRGSPQGGVLSPLIWNIIMDSILLTFEGTATKVVGYADDILLMVAGKDPGIIVDIMNRSLQRVLRWGEEKQLLFNPSKTCAVRFSQSKKFSEWKKLKMDGVTVNYEDSMKYLGIVMQKSMSWRQHILERSKKA